MERWRVWVVESEGRGKWKTTNRTEKYSKWNKLKIFMFENFTPFSYILVFFLPLNHPPSRTKAAVRNITLWLRNFWCRSGPEGGVGNEKWSNLLSVSGGREWRGYFSRATTEPARVITMENGMDKMDIWVYMSERDADGISPFFILNRWPGINKFSFINFGSEFCSLCSKPCYDWYTQNVLFHFSTKT